MCSSDLGTDEDGRLTGALEGSFGTDPATRINIRIEPDIQYSEPANWQGTLLVRQTEGDAPRLEMKLQARMEPGAAISFPDGKRTYTLQSAESLPADLDTKMAAALIKPLLALPQEDLRFLLDELDETQMERIREAANPTAEGGNTP